MRFVHDNIDHEPQGNPQGTSQHAVGRKHTTYTHTYCHIHILRSCTFIWKIEVMTVELLDRTHTQHINDIERTFHTHVIRVFNYLLTTLTKTKLIHTRASTCICFFLPSCTLISAMDRWNWQKARNTNFVCVVARVWLVFVRLDAIVKIFFCVHAHMSETVNTQFVRWVMHYQTISTG